MKYQGLVVVVSAVIVANLLGTLIKAAVTPFSAWALGGLLLLVLSLLFAVRRPNTVANVFGIPSSEVEMYAFLSLANIVVITAITYGT
jgi:hypothetical protein